MLKKVANAAAGRLDTETYSVSTLRGPNAREQSWQPFSACWQKKTSFAQKGKGRHCPAQYVVIQALSRRHRLAES
jgi:hypothetical protein